MSRVSSAAAAGPMTSISQSRSMAPFRIAAVFLMHLALSQGLPYFCLFPQTMRPGTEFSASVTLYKADRVVNLHLTIINNSTGDIVSTASVENIVLGDSPVSTLITTKVPINLTETEYLVKISGSGELTFTNSSMVGVSQRTNLLFVQTDKALYKPGQKVMFRVVIIYPTMKPYKGLLDVLIYDPKRNLIAQWLKQRNDKGVVSGELDLSTQTTTGLWTIEVKTQIDSTSKTFEVSEYVLPKFEVAVKGPSYYTLFTKKQSQQPSLFITITARYTYNQPVKGTVRITARRAISWWESANKDIFKWNKNVTLVDGQAQVEITPKYLSYMASDNSKESIPGTVPAWTLLDSNEIFVSADVTETVTGVVLTGNSTVKCFSQKYQLEFLGITPNSFKPGLLYTGFLEVKQRDGRPALLEDIRLPNGKFREVNITLSPLWSVFGRCSENKNIELKVPLSPSGIISFQTSIITNTTSSCNFNMQASFYDPSTDTTPTTSKRISPFESKAHVGIQISLKNTDSAIRAGSEVAFEIKSSITLKTINYVLMSKGEIVMTKSVSNIPTKLYTLTVKVESALAQRLAPVMRVVVWFEARNSEIISDSIDVNVEGAFANNVTLGFDSDAAVQPGKKVALKVKAKPGSTAFVLAVDQSVLLLKGGNDITQDLVLGALGSYGDNSVSPATWGRFVCRGCFWPIFQSGIDSIEVFENAKLIFLTDAYIHRKESFPEIPIFWGGGIRGPHRKGLATMSEFVEDKEGDGDIERRTLPGTTDEPKTTVRVLFPETWIWDNRTIGSNGIGRFEAAAPDTITSWVASAFAVHNEDGLGISPLTSTLTVFRPFFVSLTIPYSIVRGEEFVLQATVFNYLNTSLTVDVTLKNSSSFKVILKKKVHENQDMVKTIQVPGNDAATVSFWIRAVKSGEMPIEVLAQADVAGDGERRTVLVRPEGIEQEYSTSVLIDNSKKNRLFETTWDVSLPSNDLVDDSARLQVTVLGDLLGATLRGLEQLIRMPYGCGEQLMMSIAPNVYILQYLRSTDSLTGAIETRCKKYLISGYQSELTFQRLDGSFSAFGENDPSGSLWLSAYVVNVFNQARSEIPIEDLKLARTLLWIMDRQNINGSFTEPPEGRIIHTDMQGGASYGVTLTAYVLISLINNQENTAMNRSSITESIERAVEFLELQLESVEDSYSLCVMSYALVLAKSSEASVALSRRDVLAIKTDDQVHWEKVDPTSPVHSDSFIPPFTQAHALDIEMTSYALLTSVIQKNVTASLPIVRWLLAQRNPNGGFVSTQDTVMALQALARFSSLMYAPRSSFKLRVTASIKEETHAFDPVTESNLLNLQIWEPPVNSGSLSVKASGIGIALVQLNVKYNVIKLPYSNGLSLRVNPVVVGDGTRVVLTTCAKWVKEDQTSGMAIEIIQLLSGYIFESIKEVNKTRGWIKKVEKDSQAVSIYYDRLDDNETCISVTMVRQVVVSNLKSATVKIVDYYKPNNFVTATYGVKLPSICVGCD